MLLSKSVILITIYIDDWEKFNETSLPEKEEFYSNLNIEDITDADYIHVKKVLKDFQIKILGDPHKKTSQDLTKN